MKTMKNFALSSITSAAILFCGSALASDGSINFSGKITDQTCTINGGSKSLTLTLPTISFSSLKTIGDTAGRTPFAIQLTNCTANSKVSTYFLPGPSVNFATGRLKNQSTGSGAASEVELQLLGDNGQFLPILSVGADGNQANSQWVTVDATGAASMNYYSEYYATGASKAGTMTTALQFNIIYQ
ncbi:MAG TPA: fimbrial protein [Xylella sp.]